MLGTEARHCPIAPRGSSTEWTGLNWGCSWFTQGSIWENGVAQRRRVCHVKAAAARGAQLPLEVEPLQGEWTSEESGHTEGGIMDCMPGVPVHAVSFQPPPYAFRPQHCHRVVSSSGLGAPVTHQLPEGWGD